MRQVYGWFIADGQEIATGRLLFAGAILEREVGTGREAIKRSCEHRHHKIREAIKCGEQLEQS